MFVRNNDIAANSSEDDAPVSTGKKLLILCFVLFWSSLTLLADTAVGYRALKQLQANGFPTAEGKITKSATVKSGSGMGGTTYGVDVAYDFTVDEKAYSGHQFRYGSSGGSYDDASRVVQSLPVGREVDVFYNSVDPQDCVLSRGLNGGDLCLPMFLMPFNLFMLAQLAGLPYLVRSIFQRHEHHSETVLIDDGSPLSNALVVLGFASFFMTFAVVIPFGFDPPKRVMQIVWLILIAITIGTYIVVCRWRKVFEQSLSSLTDCHRNSS